MHEHTEQQSILLAPLAGGSRRQYAQLIHTAGCSIRSVVCRNISAQIMQPTHCNTKMLINFYHLHAATLAA